MGQIKFLTILKDRLSRCNQNKRKTAAPHVTHILCSLVLLLTTSFQLLASYKRCLPSACLHLFLRLTFAVLQKPCQENFVKFQEFYESRFGGSENDRYFLKILKWQYKLVRDYKLGKLVSYFLNNAAETCLYGLKISGNIEIEHIFQPKAFFHLSGNLHTSRFSAFNEVACHLQVQQKKLMHAQVFSCEFRKKKYLRNLRNSSRRTALTIKQQLAIVLV